MKLSPLFAIVFLVLVQPAMAGSEPAPQQVPPSIDTQTTDSNRVELAITDLDDFDDDICWVAPEWRETLR